MIQKKNNIPMQPDDVETWWHYVQSVDRPFHEDRLDALRKSSSARPIITDHITSENVAENVSVSEIFVQNMSVPSLSGDSQSDHRSQPLRPSRTDGLTTKQLRRFRQGNWMIDATLDLHGQKLHEAQQSVANFLNRSVQSCYRCILIITGKGSILSGSGIIKRHIVSWLEDSAHRNDILGISQAHIKDGGDGAMYVLLKRKRR